MSSFFEEFFYFFPFKKDKIKFSFFYTLYLLGYFSCGFFTCSMIYFYIKIFNSIEKLIEYFELDLTKILPSLKNVYQAILDSINSLKISDEAKDDLFKKIIYE